MKQISLNATDENQLNFRKTCECTTHMNTEVLYTLKCYIQLYTKHVLVSYNY